MTAIFRNIVTFQLGRNFSRSSRVARRVSGGKHFLDKRLEALVAAD
jgi:hypothetical protein